MWRYLAGGSAFCLLLGVGLFLAHELRSSSLAIAPPAAANATSADDMAANLAPPEADQRSKEMRRFNRYDADRDGKIAPGEFLATRRKAFLKLDTNGDGRLSFEEYAIKAQAKFAKADQNRSGALDRAEFATTKPVRKARPIRPCAAQPSEAKDGAKDAEAES